MACSTLYPNLSTPGKADKHRTLKERIPDIYHHPIREVGYRRITLALRRSGGHVNHKTAQCMMGELSAQLHASENTAHGKVRWGKSPPIACDTASRPAAPATNRGVT
ncbi:IS3 family transposase [Tatumella sp. JGM118]|uniref:IS3 family transposase n=1 Tax=Tatumella sp. JGM118 TaxID=2799796 RepID=UPI001BAE5F5B|nr:transposase [Tatumella sp. JGM118]